MPLFSAASPCFKFPTHPLEQRETANQPIIVFTTFDAIALSYNYKGANKILPDEKFFAADGTLRLQTDASNEMQLRKSDAGLAEVSRPVAARSVAESYVNFSGHLFLANASVPDPDDGNLRPMLGYQGVHWSFVFMQ